MRPAVVACLLAVMVGTGCRQRASGGGGAAAAPAASASGQPAAISSAPRSCATSASSEANEPPPRPLRRCFPERLRSEAWRAGLKSMIASYGESLINDPALCDRVRASSAEMLRLDDGSAGAES